MRLDDDPWRVVEVGLTLAEPPYPIEIARWALTQREALTPPFLALVERVSAAPANASAQEAALFNWAFIYLAVWRETRAWMPLLALLRHPIEQVEDLLGDMLTESYGRALASVCPGDVEPLRLLAMDDALSPWARIAVLHAWSLRVQRAGAPLTALEDCLLSLGEARLRAMTSADVDEAEAGEDDDADAYDHEALLCDVIRHAGALRSARLRPAVMSWFAADVLNPLSIRLSDYEHAMGPAAAGAADGADGSELRRHDDFIHDPVVETSWWACWAARSTPLRAQADDPAPTTYVREVPKVGRNDPCPCGSGRKFKKCHGA